MVALASLVRADRLLRKVDAAVDPAFVRAKVGHLYLRKQKTPHSEKCGVRQQSEAAREGSEPDRPAPPARASFAVTAYNVSSAAPGCAWRLCRQVPGRTQHAAGMRKAVFRCN
ncbi:hypothetical protein [Cupriavidus basilensis]|uniref:hypothetical protein n=1 Tax=Cupriavidus basilensis TaxID=68895 RepID=UPI003D343A5C